MCFSGVWTRLWVWKLEDLLCSLRDDLSAVCKYFRHHLPSVIIISLPGQLDIHRVKTWKHPLADLILLEVIVVLCRCLSLSLHSHPSCLLYNFIYLPLHCKKVWHKQLRQKSSLTCALTFSLSSGYCILWCTGLSTQWSHPLGNCPKDKDTSRPLCLQGNAFS